MVRFVARLALLVAFVATAPAVAEAAPPDPTSNHGISPPQSCWRAGVNTICINDAVQTLNAARSGLGQPPYALPADFAALDPTQQVLILSNLDRALYGLPPITGLTAELNADAAVGASQDADPTPTNGNYRRWGSNWAGGYPNIVYAYEGWMYDDGPGSGNLDCPVAGADGCWGHRHNVLLDFGGPNGLAMGVASVIDPQGSPSYTQLLFGGNQVYVPSYGYTWAQAQADGAGTNVYDVKAPVPVSLQLSISGAGSVSDRSGASCATSCVLSETLGTAATLTATPAPGQTFAGWSGACSGTGACSITPTTALTAITATFQATPVVVALPITPTVAPALAPATTSTGTPSTGTGTATAVPAITIRLLSRTHRTLKVTIAGPAGVARRCALSKASAKASRAHFTACGSTLTYRHLTPGSYVLRVRSPAGAAQLAVKITR